MSRGKSLRQLWVLMVTAFVDMIGFAIIFPLLPYYAQKLGADGFKVGALVGIFFLAQFLASPFWGKLSDRWGRRPVIFYGLILQAVAFIIFELAGSVWLLFLSRFVQGAGGGKTGVLQAYVSDTAEPSNRAEALGWLSAATSAGVMIGPVIGSVSSESTLVRPGYIAAALCVVSLLFAWRWLPESIARPETQETEDIAQAAHAVERGGGTWSLVGQVLSRPRTGIAPLIWIYAMGMMAFMAMNGILVLYLELEFGITQKTIGYFFFYVATVSLIMRALILGPMVRRFGEVRVLQVGAICVGLGLLAVPAAASFAQLAVSMVLIPAGTALLFPTTTSLVSAGASRNQTGMVLGVHQGFGGVSRMIGPFWAGWVYEHIGVRQPFWLAAGLMLLATVLALSINGRRRATDEAADVEPVLPG